MSWRSGQFNIEFNITILCKIAEAELQEVV